MSLQTIFKVFFRYENILFDVSSYHIRIHEQGKSKSSTALLADIDNVFAFYQRPPCKPHEQGKSKSSTALLADIQI